MKHSWTKLTVSSYQLLWYNDIFITAWYFKWPFFVSNLFWLLFSLSRILHKTSMHIENWLKVHSIAFAYQWLFVKPKWRMNYYWNIRIFIFAMAHPLNPYPQYLGHTSSHVLIVQMTCQHQSYVPSQLMSSINVQTPR